MKGGKNQVVHVYPNSTPPVRRVVLCIMFHIHSATQQEIFQRSHNIIFFFIVVALKISFLGGFS